MSKASSARVVVLLGLGACLGSTGCGAALAEVGARTAELLIAAATSPSTGSSSTPAATSPPETTAGTPCRQKQAEWRRTADSVRQEPPPHLRCKPDGDWPDEDEVLVRSGGGGGL